MGLVGFDQDDVTRIQHMTDTIQEDVSYPLHHKKKFVSIVIMIGLHIIFFGCLYVFQKQIGIRVKNRTKHSFPFPESFRQDSFDCFLLPQDMLNNLKNKRL